MLNIGAAGGGRSGVFHIFDLFVDLHLDFFKVVELEISCLGSRSKNPELEYVLSYDTSHFSYFFRNLIFRLDLDKSSSI